MLRVRDFLMVMFKSAFIVAFLSLPKPIVAFTGFKNWSRKALYTKVDLCTQSCYSQIIPGLYLSNVRAANDHFLLQSLGITHILTVEAQRLPTSIIEDLSIRNLFIMAFDTQDTKLLPFFPIANSFIEEGLKHGNVLVHCRLGVSRSATLVIAYLMEKYKLPFAQAFVFVRRRRPFINPNPAFVRQLKLYERNNYYVSGFKRLEAYLKVNGGENKYRMMSYGLVMVGLLIPIAVLFG